MNDAFTLVGARAEDAAAPLTRTCPCRTSSFTSRRDHRPVPASTLSRRSILPPPLRHFPDCSISPPKYKYKIGER